MEFFLPSRKACSGIHETQTAFKTSTQTQQTPKPEKGGKIPFVLHVTLKDATTSWGDVRKGRGVFFLQYWGRKKIIDVIVVFVFLSIPSCLSLPFSQADVAVASSQGTETLNLTGGGVILFQISWSHCHMWSLHHHGDASRGNKEIRSSQRPVYHRKALAKGGL